MNEEDEWEDVGSELYSVEIQGYSNSTDETKPLHQASMVKVIGLETPNPILQIDGFIFKGQYENTAGTTVFLDGDDSSHNRAQVESLTEKKLVFNRCLLSRKDTSEANDFFTGNQDDQGQDDESETSDEEIDEPVEDLLETIVIDSSDEEKK